MNRLPCIIFIFYYRSNQDKNALFMWYGSALICEHCKWFHFSLYSDAQGTPKRILLGIGEGK